MDIIESIAERFKLEGEPQKIEDYAKLTLGALLKSNDPMIRQPVQRMIQAVVPTLINHVRLQTEVGNAIRALLEAMQDENDPAYEQLSMMEVTAVQMFLGSITEAIDGN